MRNIPTKNKELYSGSFTNILGIESIQTACGNTLSFTHKHIQNSSMNPEN
jgi:hypothetical protein